MIVMSFESVRKMMKFALIFIISGTNYSCALKTADRSMDISDVIERKNHLDDFITKNFENIYYEFPAKPLPFYSVHLINKTRSFEFCNMNIEQCWVKKIDTLYAFFILIKKSAEIEKHISQRYGKWETSAEIVSQNGIIDGDLFSWRVGDLKIDVSTYFNTSANPRYDECCLVVCRNMTHGQLSE